MSAAAGPGPAGVRDGRARGGGDLLELRRGQRLARRPPPPSKIFLILLFMMYLMYLMYQHGDTSAWKIHQVTSK